MNFPLSFYITKFDLTLDRYIEALNEGVEWDGPCGCYGDWMLKNEPFTLQESYEDWVAQEIWIIEEHDEYRGGERSMKFQIIGGENARDTNAQLSKSRKICN